MCKDMVFAGIFALLIGLGAGAATTYYWLARYRYADHANTESVHADGAEQGHAGHDEHEESKIKLSPEAISRFGVEVAQAGGGQLEKTLRLPGEIALNADRVAHIVPRVAGMVREVHKNLGDKVETGELLAVLESRELAEAKAADLATEARLRLAESNFKRIEELLAKKIAPEQEYFEARQKLEETRIQHRETQAKLHALGLAHEQLTAALDEKDGDFSRYEIRAPFPGTIVEKHITLGEVHDSSHDVFVLADLSTVWADIALYAEDAARVRVGSPVRLVTAGQEGRSTTTEGTIFYVSPIVRESTRTGLARALIANEANLWRPGSFVTAQIVVSRGNVLLLVPNEAIQTVENQPVVFVAAEDGFGKRAITTGKSNDLFTEVLSGIKPGDRYVTKGAFILKAEVSKGAGGHEH